MILKVLYFEMAFDRKKWGLVLKVMGIVAAILVLRGVASYFGFAETAPSPLLTAVVGGVVFTIAIIFSGTMADFKESERIPGEFATSVKALYNDGKVMKAFDEKLGADFQESVKSLLAKLNSNFKSGGWNLDEINSALTDADNAVVALAKKGVAPPLIARLRAELEMVDRLSNRVDVIRRTSFIPAAYAISEVAIAAVILILLFVKTEAPLEGFVLVGVISALLIGLLLLIKDMDDPFEVGGESHADVDLGILFELEKRLK